MVPLRFEGGLRESEERALPTEFEAAGIGAQRSYSRILGRKRVPPEPVGSPPLRVPTPLDKRRERVGDKILQPKPTPGSARLPACRSLNIYISTTPLPMQLLKPTNLLAGITLVLTSHAFAQSNTCSSPPNLSGEGAFSFSTDSMTESDYELSHLCETTNNSNFSSDGFFFWSPDVDGDYRFEVATATFDTQIAIYSGNAAPCDSFQRMTCAASDDDDGAGLLSLLDLTGLIATERYLIQIGGYLGQSGNGVLEIVSIAPTCSSADSSMFPRCEFSPSLPFGLSTHFATDAHPDSWITGVPAFSTLTVDVTQLSGDTDFVVFSTPAPGFCGGVMSEYEGSFTYSTGATLEVLVIMAVNDHNGGLCSEYSMDVSGALQPSFTFCTPGAPNSTGVPSLLTGTLGSGVGSGLHLEVNNGPNGALGYFLMSSSYSLSGINISQGFLCLSGSLGRYNVASGTGALNSVGFFDGSGVLQNAVGTSTSGSGFDVPSTLPLAGTPQIQPGETWHFQLWHREAFGTSNFSNGIAFTF